MPMQGDDYTQAQLLHTLCSPLTNIALNVGLLRGALVQQPEPAAAGLLSTLGTGDATEGVEVARRRKPDAIILDLVLAAAVAEVIAERRQPLQSQALLIDEVTRPALAKQILKSSKRTTTRTAPLKAMT